MCSSLAPKGVSCKTNKHLLFTVLLFVFCCSCILSASCSPLSSKWLHETTQVTPFHVRLGPNYAASASFLSGRALLRKKQTLNTEVGVPLSKAQEDNGKWFDFLPTFSGNLFPSSSETEALEWIAVHCSYSATMELQSKDKTKGTTAVITIKAKPRNEWQFTCGDLHLFATVDSLHVHDVMVPGVHTIEMENLNENQLKHILSAGLQVFSLKESSLETVIDIWHIYKLFGSRDAPEDQVIQFLEKNMGLKPEKRQNTFVNLTENDVKEGDVIFYWTISGGPDDLILWGTGSHATHTAVILRMEDGHMYVCESTDPIIRKTRFDKWTQSVHGTHSPHVLLRLSPHFQKRFNNTKAVEIFNHLDGTPYGFQNFMFGWIDTPENNFPNPMSPQLLATALWLSSKVLPAEVGLIFGQALNQRLGNHGCCPEHDDSDAKYRFRHSYFQRIEHVLNKPSNSKNDDCPVCLTIDEVFNAMTERNISFETIITMPEQDSWNYHTGKALVCDSMVTYLFKNSGVFDEFGFPPVALQATEFTPKDVYNLDIFTADPSLLPASCRSAAARGSRGFCQFVGNYWMDLPDFNTIEPYAHMNERCGALPTKYIRSPPKC